MTQRRGEHEVLAKVEELLHFAAERGEEARCGAEVSQAAEVPADDVPVERWPPFARGPTYGRRRAAWASESLIAALVIGSLIALAVLLPGELAPELAGVPGWWGIAIATLALLGAIATFALPGSLIAALVIGSLIAALVIGSLIALAALLPGVLGWWELAVATLALLGAIAIAVSGYLKMLAEVSFKRLARPLWHSVVAALVFALLIALAALLPGVLGWWEIAVATLALLGLIAITIAVLRAKERKERHELLVAREQARRREARRREYLNKADITGVLRRELRRVVRRDELLRALKNETAAVEETGPGSGTSEREFKDRAEHAWSWATESGDPTVSEVDPYNAGVLLEWLGAPEEAEAAYRRGDERGDDSAASNLGALLQQGDIAGAAYNLGVLLERRGDLAGAEAAYRRSDGRGHRTAAYNLGLLLQERGDLEGAEALFKRAAVSDEREAAEAAQAALGELRGGT